MESRKILIIDDNKSVRESLKLLLEDFYSDIACIGNPNAIYAQLRDFEPDLVLLDMNFSAGINTGNEGLFWLQEINKTDPDMVVILITAYGSYELAVKSVKQGAFDFISKPWDNKKLLATVRAGLLYRESKQEIQSLKKNTQSVSKEIKPNGDMVWGRSDRMKELHDLIRKVSGTDTNVLIEGENGTGKELIAHQIHDYSKRSDEIFLPVDMGVVHENLFESELFGHAKGAFTDAHEDKIGKFAMAQGGSLFLDEIGNLSLNLQSKLLTALQNRFIHPVGSNKKVELNIRLISATNMNLQEMIEEKLFRQDLYYRLNTIRIKVPALRERPEDIIPLVDHFLKFYERKYHKQGIRINEDAYETLYQYKWPGNVRELRHSIEKLVILNDSGIVKGEDIALEKHGQKTKAKEEIKTLADAEKQTIAEALKYYKGNIMQTAKALNIRRQTLYAKIKKYGL